MDCEDNLPAPRESLRTELELGTVLLGREPIIDRYYRIAKDLAGHYRITLCDEPEAALIGQTVWSDIAFNRGTEVSRLTATNHLSFLRNYLNLHGLSSSVVSANVRRVLDWRSSGTMTTDMWDYVTGEYDISAAEVTAEIRRLAGIYSVATPQQAPAVQAEPGGVIIRGSTFDFPACIPAEATAFRNLARRRASGHYSVAASGTASGGVPGSPYARYQVNKCGDREYALRTDATPRSYRPLADGLAPTRPPRAKAGFSFACCILEAKYIVSPDTTLYQKRRDFLRNATRGIRFIPRRLQGMGRPALIAAWEAARAEQAAQFGLYMGAIVDPDIPYWRVVYICSRESAREYCQDIMNLARIPRAIAVACVSDARRTTENWIV
jgi:hypothetical protein